jgi:hypothetical protein
MALFQGGSAQFSRTLISLGYRDYRLLFFGTSLSHVGDFVQAMAQGWLVWTMTNSPFLLGPVGFAQALPRLLLGAVGGAIAHAIGTPHAIAISGAICSVFASVLLYQQRQPRENLAAENLKRDLA